MVVGTKENKVGKGNKRIKILDGVARNGFTEKINICTTTWKRKREKLYTYVGVIQKLRGERMPGIFEVWLFKNDGVGVGKGLGNGQRNNRCLDLV